MPQSLSVRAEPGPRHRLVSPAALVCLVALVGAALAAVFPGASLVEQVYRYGRIDTVSATYIGSLLHADPDNRRLRLIFVRRLLEQGDTRGARAAFAPLGAAADADRDVRLLEYRLAFAEASEARDPEAAARLRARALRELAGLAPLDWPAEDLAQLAEDAGALGAPGLAIGMYGRLAARDVARADAWTERAARTALAAGDYRATAGAYVAAAERAPTAAGRRDYLVKAIRALQSGNRLGEALALADAHLDALAADDGTLVFLIRLARAANDGARAQAYAKRLLKMSARSVAVKALAALLDALSSVAHAAEVRRDAGAPPGMRPYDDEKYTLAWEVFLAAGNLEDAHRVAAAAVAQAPAAVVWRQRLAQVAEWTGRAPQALEQWRHLAARADTAREREQAWQAVLRLAPAVRDDEALLAAWLHEADTQPMNAERWRRIADAFERVGRAEAGAVYFGRRYAKSGDEMLLELQATLLERVGRDEDAIPAYRRLIEKHRATGARLLRVAVLLLRHNRFREAYDVLDRHRAAVESGDPEFWTLFAELAWKLQQDAAARDAYRILATRPQAGEVEWRRLVALTRETDPGGAARIAALGFERLHGPALLLLAAELNWEQRDMPALRRLYSQLTAEDEKRMADSAYFYALRAQFHDAEDRPREAAADYRRAIAIEPANPEWTAALLWHLVSRKDLPALRRELQLHAARARETGVLWEPYAAAHVLLGEIPRALAWYARLRDARRDDYLWLVNYADVLDQGGQAALALRVRRHAWQVLRTALREKEARALSAQEVEALARMTLAGGPADQALRLVGRILRQDFVREPPAAPERALDAGVRELVLSWALATQRYDAARIWLWQQYARTLARPKWAEMAIALADNDREAVAALLAGDPAALPPQDRIEAARMTRRLALAQSYAFEAQEARRDDDDLHLALTETLLESAHALVYEDASFERGVLKGREQRASARIWLTERLQLTFDLGSDSRLASTSPTALAGVPGRIDEYGVGLRWRHERGHTDLRIGYRSALGTHVPISLSHTRDWAPRIAGMVSATHDEKALETTPLYLGGTRDRVSGSLVYRMSLRESASAEAWTARYRTQDGAYLGRGRGVAWELAHRFRAEYPDWRVRLAGAHQSYDADGATDARAAGLDPTGGALGARYFIPESFDVIGLYAAAGDSYRDRYSRAFRFYADLGPTWNSKLGEGFLLSFGGGTSVFGHDRLVVYYTRSKGGGAIGGFTTQYGLRYEYLFDRR